MIAFIVNFLHFKYKKQNDLKSKLLQLQVQPEDLRRSLVGSPKKAFSQESSTLNRFQSFQLLA